MTYFTPGIDKYLAHWLLKDTWDTDRDIEDNFYLFIIAIHQLSHRRNKGRFDKFQMVDKTDFKNKLIRAIQNNHPDYDPEEANRLITELADKAMIVLEVLHSVKIAGDYPRIGIRGNNNLLKILK